MSLINIFFPKKIKKENNEENGKELSKEKEFTFSVTDITCIGDKYSYKVKGKNKEEAFKKLVIYFFGELCNMDHNDVKSEHYTVTYPSRDIFKTELMPHWFGKRIGGNVGTHRGDRSYDERLKKFCKDNNILRTTDY